MLKEEKDFIFLWQVYGCPQEGSAALLLKTVTNDPATLKFPGSGSKFQKLG